MLPTSVTQLQGIMHLAMNPMHMWSINWRVIKKNFFPPPNLVQKTYLREPSLCHSACAWLMCSSVLVRRSPRPAENPLLRKFYHYLFVLLGYVNYQTFHLLGSSSNFPILLAIFINSRGTQDSDSKRWVRWCGSSTLVNEWSDKRAHTNRWTYATSSKSLFWIPKLSLPIITREYFSDLPGICIY